MKTSCFSSDLDDLKRYARAVSSSQDSADAVTYAAVAGLVEGTSDQPPAVEPRVLLFRTFHEIWLPLQRIVEPDGFPLDWATFLLATTGPFNVRETGFITGRTTVEVSAILRRWIGAAAESGDFGTPQPHASVMGSPGWLESSLETGLPSQPMIA